jgi:hypothetical protein
MNYIAEMERIIESMRPTFEKIRWDDPVVYANWLSQARYIAHRSTSFLGLCLFHSHDYPDFQKRCTAHIAEETGHERLIDNDLKRIGIQLLPELAETMSVYRTQYFQIVGLNPLSFVGYIFLLELLAPAYGQFIIDRSKSTGVSFLKVHSSADEDHIGQATKIFETLSASQRILVFDNFKMTHAAYKTMLEKIYSMAIKRTEAGEILREQ